MKKLVFALLLCFGSLSAFAQATSETRTVGEFNSVHVSSAIFLELTQGDAPSVVIEGDSKYLINIKTDIENGVLSISIDGYKSDVDVKAHVTVKNLTGIEASSASSVTSTNTLTTDTLRISNSGAASIDINIANAKTKVTGSGASSTKLTGTSGTLDATVSGAASLKAYGLIADKVTISTSGASSAHVTANQSLNATSAGASEIHYQGNATDKTINASGTSGISMRGGENTNDTTRVRVGGHDVLITESDEDADERSPREKKADDGDFEFWDGFDFGVNGLLTAKNQVEMPAGFEFLSINYARSYMFSWNIYQKNIHIYRNNINLGTGIGLSWYHYNFRNSYTLQPNVPYATAVSDTLNYKRNRLGMTYVNVPLFLEFNTNNHDARNSFHIGGGMEFGYNIFNNVLKQKYVLNDHTYKNKTKDDFNVNPFRYDVIARIGYGNFTIFGKYSLSTLFEKNKGPVVYPFSAGVHLDFGP